MRIFVTGGTGFFGKSIFDYLKRHPDFHAGDEWTILSRNPEKFKAQNAALLDQDRKIGFVAGDVRDFRAEGRSAENLGIAGKTVEQVIAYLKTGE